MREIQIQIQLQIHNKYNYNNTASANTKRRASLSPCSPLGSLTQQISPAISTVCTTCGDDHVGNNEMKRRHCFSSPQVRVVR